MTFHDLPSARSNIFLFIVTEASIPIMIGTCLCLWKFNVHRKAPAETEGFLWGDFKLIRAEDMLTQIVIFLPLSHLRGVDKTCIIFPFPSISFHLNAHTFLTTQMNATFVH